MEKIIRTLVIGDNYVGNAFKGILPVMSYEDFSTSDNWQNLLSEYDVIINAVDDRTNDIRQNWKQNYKFVYDLVEFCDKYSKKLIHISTAELYGNNFEWNDTVESCRMLDMNTDYRLSKRVAERILEGTRHVVVRIKNPFDGRNDPDNWLVKSMKREQLPNWVDSYTHLPDMVTFILHCIVHDRTGIFNMVQMEVKSAYTIFNSVLEHPEQIPIMPSLESDEVFSDVNATLVNSFISPTNLDVAMLVSYNTLKSA